MAFLDESPSPFHAVTAMQRTLQEHGFNNLDPGTPWSIGDRDKAGSTGLINRRVSKRLGCLARGARDIIEKPTRSQINSANNKIASKIKRSQEKNKK